jgi:hypothetical protein
MSKDISKAKFIIYFAKFLLLFCHMTLLVGFPESSGKRLRNFPLPISFHHGSPYSYISWGMNSRPVGDRSSET